MPDFQISESINWPPVPGLRPKGHRELRVFATDASLSRAQGQVTTLRVPFELLGDRCRGQRLEMSLCAGPFGAKGQEAANLDAPHISGCAGLAPDSCDPLFGQQMVYAVSAWTLERFRRALGREPSFAFEGPLLLQPYAMEGENACYSRDDHALKFGYFYQRQETEGFQQSGTLVSTAHSHDIIVHECTHALVDGMRPNLMLPTNRDVLAMHEAIADLVALFAHFTHTDFLRTALAASSGSLLDEHLTGIAVQFGRSTNGRGPLRSGLIGAGEEVPRYSEAMSVHKRGSLLVTAVFKAFQIVYERKTSALRETARSVQLLSNHPLLIDLLAKTAASLADQFLNILIRALDYLPPVDAWFGELLRAMITADRELVPDDPWHYREALICGFRSVGIPVYGVRDLSESELVWRTAPECSTPARVQGLAELPLRANGPSAASIYSQRAQLILGFLEQNRHTLGYFGLIEPGTQGAQEITIESVRSIARCAPDGQLMLHYVAEVLQWRHVEGTGWVPGGASLVLDRDGSFLYVIRKDVANQERVESMQHFLGSVGLRYRPIFMQSASNDVAAAAAQSLSQLHLRECTCQRA